MNFKSIKSLEELSSRTNTGSGALLLLYKGGTDLGQCIFNALRDLTVEETGYEEILTADVTMVRDIHPYYNIDSVPVLMELEGDRLLRVLKGCNDSSYYRSVFSQKPHEASGQEYNPQPRVSVYSTPTCSWCNTLKNYLRDNRIIFNDIDVSTNQKAAEDMVKRSGQQGVPQTDINGEIVIGFDKARIDRLLSLN